mmetsp:Transcript_8500/g.10749  ORF Transcript_8500/g.10749 Transcript_8500/m.10749 type:complete len:342 (+) Transcript_8500:70-1095(+)|eukprot:CAMPEP_0204824670 /NCGR_PEP_ID=MMETSP1346-20131115/2664_1 /ASSEMBLY_ACC=CAM_ASM_000771 /TAXON_ID=215587 /ORGANISM="Aplanochytrium stocchinoi, Strain GSBS06" /LENGTH=341 /DNA_ID=CAMNT_0051951945 /DNA_START=179 /DNA_END=1204 /DNA_ORIENTATION=+
MEQVLNNRVPDRLVLLQFRPSWGVQAYLRFTGLRHHVENCNFPSVGTTGELPQLRDGKSLIPKKDIMDYLLQKSNADKGLSATERAQAIALRSLVANDLEWALQWSYWGDNEHYFRETKKQVGKVIPFPLNMFLPWYMRRQAMSVLEKNEIAKEEDVKKIAMRAYECLSLALGQKTWILGGESPTSIDAIVFGHLMLALNEPINEQMQSFPNLIRFCNNIRKNYFENDAVKMQQLATTNCKNMFSDNQGFKVVMKLGPMPIPLSTKRIPALSSQTKAEGIKKEESEEQKEFHRNSRNFAIIAGVVFVSYYILQSVQFVFEDDDDLVEYEYENLQDYADADE